MSTRKKKTPAKTADSRDEIKKAALEVCALVSGAEMYLAEDPSGPDPVVLACIHAILRRAYKQAVLVSEGLKK